MPSFDNRSLFSDHYLLERLPGRPEWGEDVSAAWSTLQALYADRRGRVEELSEAQLETEWVQPVLSQVLGWHYEVQTPVTGMDGRVNRPDYSLFATEASKRAAQDQRADERAYASHVAAIAEAKYWGRPLDRKVRDVRDITNANPSFQIVAYLVANGTDWGILTNGREWRLYSGRARSRIDTYYAVDLQRVMDEEDEAEFRYFLLFFRAAAFRADDATGQTFLQSVLEGSGTYARQLERRLKALIFEQIFPHLAHGFVAWRRENGVTAESDESLREIYEGTLRLLYRLLFLLHAEARGLLPTGQYSLTRIKGDVAAWRDRGDPLSPISDNFWNDLAGLFRRVDRGDPTTGMPRYNGGLFREDHPRNRFLREHRAADAFLAPALDLLARAGEPGFIDYKALSVEQLGSIYEGLLEFRLRLDAAGEPVLENDKGERKATGSYYTPHYIVEYIVAETVGPALAEREAAFRALMAEIEPKRARLRHIESNSSRTDEANGLRRILRDLDARAAETLLGIRVCDPAMGSGHFLVHATDRLTERLMILLNEFPDNPVLARIADVREQIVANLAAQGITVNPEHLKDTNLLKRMVMKQCIYGVDLNPMATELAKLSLWLDSFTVGAPLSFLDHHLKTGNSLVGTTVRQVQHEYEADRNDQLNLGGGPFAGLMQAAVLMRDVASHTDATYAEVEQSVSLYAAFETAVLPFKRVLDLWTSQYFGNGGGADFVRFHGDHAVRSASLSPPEQPARFRTAVERARTLADTRHFFHWDLEFPEVFVDLEFGRWKENPGFDAVIGNPPYVRQEQVSAVKPYLKSAYPDVYDGAADLYVYFYREGVELLRAGGRLSYIVTNKWLRAGYGAGLRDYFAAAGDVEQLIDFGHAPVFPDADVFPCIVVVRKRTEQMSMFAVVCSFPRAELGRSSVADVVRGHGFSVDPARFAIRARPARDNLAAVPAPAWSLERPDVEALMNKIRASGTPLRDFIGATPYRGILTGFNEAFLIDTPTRDRLIREDPACAGIIKPYLRGQDIERWTPAWDALWMIVLKSGENHTWPWTDAPRSSAERIFRETYPALYAHLKPSEARLQARQDKGQHWWELRSCAYYEAFERPKIVYQVIQFHPRYCLDETGFFTNDKCFFLSSNDAWLVAALNSPIMWWHNWRHLSHMKDEALESRGYRMEELPIARPSDAIRADAEPAVERLIVLTRERREATREVLTWLRTEFGIETPGQKLEAFAELNPDAFVAEARRRRPRGARALTPREVGALRITFAEYAPCIHRLDAEAGRLERRVADLVNQAYGLTPDEVELLWNTAPPRMPLERAVNSLDVAIS
jgi:hypothetical protein